MYDEYEIFILAKELADKTIPKGTRGVVLMVLDTAPYAYEVEFPDGKGGNLGEEVTYTITEQFMQPESSTVGRKPRKIGKIGDRPRLNAENKE